MSWTDYTVPNDTPVAAAIIATCIAPLCMLVLKPKADGDQFVTEEPRQAAHIVERVQRSARRQSASALAFTVMILWTSAVRKVLVAGLPNASQIVIVARPESAPPSVRPFVPPPPLPSLPSLFPSSP